jgi:hypothetical protein
MVGLSKYFPSLLLLLRHSSTISSLSQETSRSLPVASLHYTRFQTLFYKNLRPSDYTFASLSILKNTTIMSSIKSLALLALATGFASVANAAETGKTTRYWDCCKGSCSWPGKAAVSAPITTCDKNDNPLTDANTPSACDGGSAYMCSDQSPWAVSDTLAYGFAAANIAGGSEDSWCCSCYK